jgi:DNA-binding IclR family transcriptional regulator
MALITPPSVLGINASVRVKSPSERRSMSRSATRALDVLEFFGEARRPLRAIEISRMLEMHPSTTNQLLKTMVDSAHLLFNAQTMTYLPSPRLAGVSGWIVEMYGADDRLRALVRDVQARTGLIVTLTTPNDLFMQILDLMTSPALQAERGLRISVFGSAIGSAYLSTLDDAAIARLASRARIPSSAMPHILKGVAEIRQNGFADGPSTNDPVWSVAMPLPKHAFPAPMVLGIAGPSDVVRNGRDGLQQTLHDATRRWIEDRAPV